MSPTSMLPLAVFLLANCKSGPDLSRELIELSQMVNDVSAELSGLGFAVNPSDIGLEIKDAAQMAALFNHINTQSRQEGQSTIKAKPAPGVHTPAFTDGAHARLAFYDPNSKTIIFQTGAMHTMSKGYLAHELAHAYQDQKWGFDTIWRAYHDQPSKELYNITNYLIEGHAELARQAYEQAHADDQREAFDLSVNLGKIWASECVLCHMEDDVAKLPYALGMRFLAHEYVHGGWPQAESHFLKLPNSTEQIIHPDKFPRDKPSHIELPTWKSRVKPAELKLNGPMGEAYLLAKLLSLSVPDQEAFTSASGWDGDVAQIYQSADGQEATIWRIVFDRELDASQLEDTLRRVNRSNEVLKTGRTVDWIMAPDARWASLLRLFMSRNPLILPANKADQSSTSKQEIRIKHEPQAIHNPYQLTKIRIGPHW